MTFRQILQARAKKSQDTKALKKLTPYQILLGPIVTEKTYKQQEQANKYAFKVHADANKNDVKKAVQYIYSVTPEAVHITQVKQKGRNNRKLVRRSYKKAVVTLDSKDKIDIAA
jgi:large subunit ribosomal protein L23